ncbi:MAG: hypothetical protein DRJ61_14820 [Acidobacteria bacterium]|nr:MAG: hypothetical protein DRJ61_14820 [Acidobacteriota bacterium]
MSKWAVVIVLVSGSLSSMVWAQGIEDIVFYDSFESGDTSGWWAPARVGRTGQKTCYESDGTVIPCAGTSQDGEFQTGVAWPEPRFVDNSDGTVTDMLTGLVWLKNACCWDLPGLSDHCGGTWTEALNAPASLADGTCGLSDGSVAGDWRLPTRFELEGLLDLEYVDPAVSDALGTGQYTEGDAFFGLHYGIYWSSTPVVDIGYVWSVDFDLGRVAYVPAQTTVQAVWPVRSRQ